VGDQANWREERREAAAARAAALERRKAGETAQARELLIDFVEKMTARVPPDPLGQDHRGPDAGGHRRTGKTLDRLAAAGYAEAHAAPITDG